MHFVTNVFSQTTISTNFTNNNGSSIITFNFQNTNTSDVIITGIQSCTGITGANTATLWYNPTPINQATMAVNTANGWIQLAAQPFTGVANTTTNVGQPMLTGLNFVVPAGTTYGICLSLTSSLRYSTITAGNYTFSGGGCNILTGTNIGFGGTLTNGINNRGFLGSVSFISGNACTGAPNAGNTVSTASPVCPSVPFTLSMANATFSSGLTYQWQSASSATGPWTNIVGGTTSAFTTSQTVDTWYQCIVTCSSSGLSATSTPLQLTTNSFVNCYCTSGATSNTYGDIQRVELNTIDNSSTACNGTYSDYTSISTLLSPGVTYPMELDLINCSGGTYSYGTRVWIDMDHNGLFDTYELLQDSYNSLPSLVTVNVPFNITIPPTALSGLTRMRIVIIESNQTPSPCGTYTWGETEDYMINISAPPTCPQPTLINVVSSTLNDATIDWTPGGSETQWQIEWGPQGFVPGTGTLVYTSAHPFTIGSLTPYSFYQAYVRAICTPGDSSYWTPSVSWNTYNQGQYITWDNECPTGGFIDISANPGATNTNLAYLGEVGITLPFPLLYQGNLFTTMTIGATGGVKLGTLTGALNYVMEAGNGLYPFIQQLYTAYPVGSGGVYYQQVGISPNSKFVILWKNLPHWNSPIFPDGASFELIIDEATQEIYYVYDDVIMGNPTAWDYGADAEIGVRGPQNINVSMNNPTYLQNNSCVHFYYVNCPNPVALTTFYLFPNEAAFTWTASAAGETSWTVVYGPAGFDPLTSGTTITATSASVQLLNLIPLGNYDVYIYSECAGGLQSAGLFYNFQTPPICSNPTAFSSTAGLDSLMSSWSWTPYTSFYPSTGFNLQLTAQGAGLYTGTVYALDNNFTDTTTNIAWYPSQMFDVYVQAVCGQDTSQYVGPISVMMPLSNDNACGAHQIIVGAPGVLYNNTGATVAIDELGIVPPVTGAQTTTGWANNTLNHTTWFKFTAPASGNVRIDATGVEYNGQIAVYFGADCSILPSFTLEGANDNEIDGTSLAPNFTVCGLTPGAEYYIMHDGSGTVGNYTIEITEVSVYAGVEGEVLEICYGESVNLFLGITNYTLGGEWLATSPAVVLQGNTFNSQDYASQTYTFNYQVSDGCAVDQATATVVVYAAPSAGQDGSITVCLNEPFDLLMGLGGNVNLDGTWYNPSNQAMSSNLDTSGTLAGQYNYDYVVTSTICPNDTANVVVIVDGSCDYTALVEELNGQWSVYPNPATTILTVENNTGLQLKAIEILDMNGRVIRVVKVNSSLDNHIELNELQMGIYFLKMKVEGQELTKRFVKHQDIYKNHGVHQGANPPFFYLFIKQYI